MYFLLQTYCYIKRQKFLHILYVINFFFIISYSYSISNEDADILFYKGISIYKKANCGSCHFWHANGGNSHGGAAASLRESNLSYKELLKVIKCGRAGTNMPYFARTAKEDLDCNHFKKDSTNDARVNVLKGSNLLNKNELKSLTKFIVDEIQEKPIKKKYCLEFFKRREACDVYKN